MHKKKAARPPQTQKERPGKQTKMTPRPKSVSAEYKGSGKLAGKIAIITGGDSGVGRAVAVLFAREGADVTVTYLNEHQDARETQRMVKAEGRSGPEKVESFGSDVPLQRAGEPMEVAPAYVFLASSDSSYFPGQVLHPNGGEVVNA